MRTESPAISLQGRRSAVERGPQRKDVVGEESEMKTDNKTQRGQ